MHNTEFPDWAIELLAQLDDFELLARGEDVKLLTWNGRLVIRPKVAFKLIDVGTTHGYELVNSGELESYLEGRARQITVRSVVRLIARRLAAARQLSANTPAPGQSPVSPPTSTPPLVPSKRPRGRPCKRKAERAEIELRS
jgi:hypothetical protein